MQKRMTFRICVQICAIFVMAGPARAQNSGTSLKKKDGRIYAPAVQMTNDKGATVLLVGMSHQGFPKYYSRVMQHTQSWVEADPRPVKILKEFFTAEQPVFDNADRTVDQAEVDQLPEYDFKSPDFLKKTEQEIAPLLKAFRMQKSQPKADVDGQTRRPAYYVDRNQAACAKAEKFGATCQWASLKFNESRQVQSVDVDLKIDEWPAGLQFLASALFRAEGWKLRSNDPRLSKINDAAFALVLDFRNELLLQQLEAYLNSGEERLILPWGAAHLKGLHQALLTRGFRTQGVADILLMDTDDFGKWPELDHLYSHPYFPLSDHYDFQDNEGANLVAEVF